MSVLRNQREFKERHQAEHEQGITSKLRGIFCQQCYPIHGTTIPETFGNFWTRISEDCYTITYTPISVVTLKVLSAYTRLKYQLVTTLTIGLPVTPINF